MSGITFASINLGKRGTSTSTEREIWRSAKNNAKDNVLKICVKYSTHEINLKTEVNQIALDLQKKINLAPQDKNHLNEKHIEQYIKILQKCEVSAKDATILLTNILTMARHEGRDGKAPIDKINYFWYNLSKYNGANPTQSIKDFVNSQLPELKKDDPSLNLVTTNENIEDVTQGLIHSCVGKVYATNDELEKGFNKILPHLDDNKYIDDNIFICTNYLESLDDPNKLNQVAKIIEDTAPAKVQQQLNPYLLKIFLQNNYNNIILNCYRLKTFPSLEILKCAQKHELQLPKPQPEQSDKHSQALAMFHDQQFEDNFKLIQQAAENGDAQALANLGRCYENGRGVGKDIDEALECYTEAAEEQNSFAIYNLGRCYANGKGVAKNQANALECYKKAATLGNTQAMYKLGRYHASGKGVDKNPAKAVNWYQQAAELGDAHAMYYLGRCYASGMGVAKNKSKAFNCYQQAAELGDAHAMSNLGVCYADGIGVAQNQAKAFSYYQQAAELGYAPALSNLGVCYTNGIGVTKDKVKAVSLYMQAAELGDAQAMSNLGVCYEKGLGVEKDEAMAFNLYTQAVNLGNLTGMANLGVCYERGLGVEKNPIVAAEWFNKAGDVDSLTRLISKAADKVSILNNFSMDYENIPEDIKVQYDEDLIDLEKLEPQDKVILLKLQKNGQVNGVYKVASLLTWIQSNPNANNPQSKEGFWFKVA